MVRSLVFLGLLTLLGAVVHRAFVRDMAEAHARLANRSTAIDTPFGAVEYASVGSGVPILVIHGAGGGFDQGIDVTGALTAQGFRLIAPSRFGYLGSSWPARPTTQAQADVYVELLEKEGIDKVFVVAVSAGEWSGLQFAVRHPDRCRALVLLVPASHLPTAAHNYGGTLLRVMMRSDFAAWSVLKVARVFPRTTAETLLGTPAADVLAASPSERARIQRVLDQLVPMRARSRGMQFDIETASVSDTYSLSSITCPVLTISAEDDLFNTAPRARYVAAHVPSGRAIVFRTGGHALVGRQDETLREVVSFMKMVKG
jgi:pimeloyl-ACP methyl ester carboxylesterase